LALGAKLPPENTALPVVSPTTPTIGKAESTTNGTWTNEPTSYTYAWLRCSTAGTECVSIAGATSSSYTVVEADAGHTLVSAVTAINAFGSTTAQSKATGKIVLPTQYWYACVKGAGGWPTGGYSDPGCTTEVLKGIYGWKKPTASTSFTVKGNETFTLEWLHAFGLTTPPSLNIACSSQSMEGSVENPAGGGAGKASSTSGLQLSGCTLTQPSQETSKCQVTESGAPLSGVATELGGKPAIRFEGSPVFSIKLASALGQSCAYQGTYQFQGSLTAVSNGASSSLEFTKAGSSLISLAHAATLEGTAKIETKAGEALKLAS
jgi:hypothetical protein